LEVGITPGADLEAAADPAEGFVGGVGGDGLAADFALGVGRGGGGFTDGFLGQTIPHFQYSEGSRGQGVLAAEFGEQLLGEGAVGGVTRVEVDA